MFYNVYLEPQGKHASNLSLSSESLLFERSIEARGIEGMKTDVAATGETRTRRKRTKEKTRRMRRRTWLCHHLLHVRNFPNPRTSSMYKTYIIPTLVLKLCIHDVVLAV